MLSFEIEKQDHCRRLESFLRNLLPTSPFAYPRKLIKSGAVRVNSQTAAPDTFLFLNDCVAIKESAAFTSMLADKQPELDILYEDDHIAIVNKPASLAMHRTAEIEENLVDFATTYMARRGTACKLYPVNRLDRGTSGAVILAKSSSSAGIFGRQVKDTGLDKIYLALAEGITDEFGVIDAPLDGKASETRYQTLAKGQGCCLLAVVPISGRMHQIRRHLEMIGHSVMGDKRYGSHTHPGLNGFALHSFRTSLAMPNGTTMTVCAPLPEDIRETAARYGIGQETVMAALQKLLGCCNLGD